MNKKQIRHLYNEALRESNDLMDQGRAEIARELISLNTEYLARWYPDYYTCRKITLIDRLSKIVFGEIEGDQEKALDQLVEEENIALKMAHVQELFGELETQLQANTK